MSYDSVVELTIVLAAFALSMLLLLLRFEVEIINLRAEMKAALEYVGNVKYRGIYRIRCRENGAEYIGSTRSNFMARWGQHMRDLNNGKHISPRLQADWITYGRSAFQFMIIEVMDDDDEIVARERAIIADRAATVPPILNYNVAHSRIYPVPTVPEHV